LARALTIGIDAAKLGFDWERTEDALDKVEEELEEVREALQLTVEKQRDELGDLLFAVVNICRKVGISPDDALNGTCDKFERRFQFIIDTLTREGRTPEQTSLSDMEELWTKAKRGEQGTP
jgi:ATP diphosphatase